MAVVVLEQSEADSSAVATDLKFPLVNLPPDEGYYLLMENGQWIIRNKSLGERFKISFDPLEELKRLEAQRLNPKKDLFCRALGVSDRTDAVVVDGTLGFAKDALHLVACKRKVIGVERNPLVSRILKSGLDISGLKSLEIIEGAIEDQLSSIVEDSKILYLDPMFEDLKSKSAPKKNMAFLRQVVDPSMDVEAIVNKARGLNWERIVVKRAKQAEPLAGKPQRVIEGKLIRFDIYL